MASASPNPALPAPPGVGGGSLNSAAAAIQNETVVRGEIVQRDNRPTFVSVRRLRWGTQIVSEKPLLLVEEDPAVYLCAEDADPRLAELAEALGDASRLAAYVAFKQLHERRQKELLALWWEGIEDVDPVAKALNETNRCAVDAFLQDRPEFAKSVYWSHFVLVASIFGRFGIQNSDGSRGVYELCSQVRHSCRPNAAWFTLRRGYPKGRKVLHCIALDGITKGEEITVSEVPESVLIMPRPQRALRIFGGSGPTCQCKCKRCAAGNDREDEAISAAFRRLQDHLAVHPPTDDSTSDAHGCLQDLDKLLPFSMQLKAKSKVLLASAFGELASRAAWQEENRGANIIQWTGHVDAASHEQRLKDTKRLYETAAKDFEYLLGQEAIGILRRLEAGYEPVRDQHKMLAKYAKEKEKDEARSLEEARNQEAASLAQEAKQARAAEAHQA